MRATAKLGLVAALSCALGCEPCGDQSSAAIVEVDEVDGFERYDLHYPNTGESVRLFLDHDDTLVLVHVDLEGRLRAEGQVHASLSPEALTILEDTEDQLAGGTELGALDPACLTFVDAPISRLTVRASQATLQFSYPLGCAPPLLATLDEMYRDLLLYLPTCGESSLFVNCQAGD